ncbi:MAG: hypothetical protein [Caudoviricetes sp.]|nr:MAG: hypothetical protein [Caudoviricetes sp.]
MITSVTKANGSVVPFDVSKLRKWSEFASEGKVSWSEIELDAVKAGYDKMTTRELHSAMIAACTNRKDTKYAKMAARLLIGQLYKDAHGGFNSIPSLPDFVSLMEKKGLWEKMGYSEQDLKVLDKVVNHNKNLDYTYSILRQWADKYLVVDNVNKTVFESPQFAFMGIAMKAMQNQPSERRLQDVKTFYKYISDLKINLPSPYLTTMRTPIAGSASCCLFTADDTAESLSIANHLGHQFTLANAGIGAYLQTRAAGSGVKSNRIIHGGLAPYYRWMESGVGASKQSCYSDDTEILTQRGFIKFSELTDTDLVSQVYGDGSSEFIKPKGIFEYNYSGDMYSFTSNRNMGIDLLVTPNHRMAYLKSLHSTNEETIKERGKNGWHKIDSRYQADKEFLFEEAETFEPKRSTALLFGGKSKGDCELSMWERLEIAFQADGYTIPRKNYEYTFHFSKQRKIDRLIWIATELGLKYEISERPTSTVIRVEAKKALPKDFDHICLIGKSSRWADEFLREAVLWDGSLVTDSSKDTVSLQSTTKGVIDFFQAVASMCGAYSHVTEHKDSRIEKGYKDLHCIYVSFDRKYTTGRAINKIKEQYSGKVYCVEVETGAIVVRRNGKTVVCGNSRGGSATITFSCLEPDWADLIRLKNPTTPNEKRIDKLDYSVVVNTPFLKRAARSDGEWMLVSYHEAPELYEAMYKSEEEFEEVYAKVSRKRIKKKFVNAQKMLLDIVKQRFETGRIYLFFADNVNKHTPFRDTIYQSNLC